MPILFKEVSHIYSEGTPFRYSALTGINLNIKEGKITAIIGATGSGKSTLVQHLNALLLPTSGSVTVFDRVITSDEKPKNLKSLRKDIGLVFQFPEYQLFEETVLKDVEFGPKNFNIENSEEKAKQALKMVDIDASLFERSPLELSGGQKRRVAIAGILAMDPKVIVLDEPTAGLDPSGSKSMMKLFLDLNKKYNKTIIIVTHDMEQVLNYCDEVVVMSEGKIKYESEVKTFFKDSSLCKSLGILPPNVIRLKDELIEKGYKIDDDVMDIKSLVKIISRQVKK
ncbi:MAG: energy-coupling factor transporter ATPase [Erysipelotrichaceae bacterium]|nr:energy-coupling factor transporter ATPase [Erysipelotrichaceae bacterium]